MFVGIQIYSNSLLIPHPFLVNWSLRPLNLLLLNLFRFRCGCMPALIKYFKFELSSHSRIINHTPILCFHPLPQSIIFNYELSLGWIFRLNFLSMGGGLGCTQTQKSISEKILSYFIRWRMQFSNIICCFSISFNFAILLIDFLISLLDI